jgi:hypothetical protein
MKVAFLLFSLFVWWSSLTTVFSFLPTGSFQPSLSRQWVSSFYQNHRLYRLPLTRVELNRIRNRRRWFSLKTLKNIFDFDKFKDALKLTEEEQLELQNYGKSINLSEDGRTNNEGNEDRTSIEGNITSNE